MAYQIKTTEPVTQGIRRIIREQVALAWQLPESEPDLHERIRGVRRICKRLRGLFRLIEPVITSEEFSAADAAVRDAARSLSHFRDAAAVAGILNKITRKEALNAPIREIKTAQDFLETGKSKLHGNALVKAELLAALETLSKVAVWAVDWQIEEQGFQTVGPGFRKSYKRAAKEMEGVFESPTIEALHEWRKSVKYHWFHLLLLCQAWRPVVAARAKEADGLGECLGDDHDCAVLSERLGTEFPHIQEAIRKRRARLLTYAHATGRRLFAEDPNDLAETFGLWWKAS